MEKEILYKPKDLYDTQLKKQYSTAANQYFDMLIRNTNTDEEANRLHVKKYNAIQEKLNAANKVLRGLKAKKGWLIAGSILMFIAAVVLIVIPIVTQQVNQLWWLFLIGAACIGFGIWFIFVAKNFTAKIKDAAAVVAKIEKELNDQYQVCLADLAELNKSFDWNMPAEVMERCTPIIDLDKQFSNQKYWYLKEHFGFNLADNPDESVLGVLSGNIQGNPFVLEKTFNCKIANKRYEGQLTIYWTTTERDSKGNTYTVQHSQTLYAHVEHPAPFYNGVTKLVYGNEAAPHLSFSRYPSGASSFKDEKELNKYVEKQYKKLTKKSDKDITKGGGFTALGNDKFDVLFNAQNRDNEVEFRLLFTPLAQNNMVELMTENFPYGDDFAFHKRKMTNVIISNHSQNFDYSADPATFRSHSVDIARQNFVKYSEQFIEHLYFDLAPLMSIPLYQMHKTYDYIYEKPLSNMFPAPEHEALANKMNKSFFTPSNADKSLPLILKSTSASKVGDNSDRVNIHSYSFHTTPMVDYVSVYGNDGKWHNVPVHWIKYDRVDMDQSIEVRSVDASERDVRFDKINQLREIFGGRFDGGRFERGLLATLVASNGSAQEIDAKLSSLFKK